MLKGHRRKDLLHNNTPALLDVIKVILSRIYSDFAIFVWSLEINSRPFSSKLHLKWTQTHMLQKFRIFIDPNKTQAKELFLTTDHYLQQQQWEMNRQTNGSCACCMRDSILTLPRCWWMSRAYRKTQAASSTAFFRYLQSQQDTKAHCVMM